MTDASSLPRFRYHPNPMETGSVIASDARCVVCGEARGFVYADGTPEAAISEISERTPGYSAWQSEVWPSCCDDATAFVGPVGIAELRERYRELEGFVLSHIIYELAISGGAATRMLQSLRRDASPTAYLFTCLHCGQPRVHVDHT